jgi:hypothetical protein
MKQEETKFSLPVTPPRITVKIEGPSTPPIPPIRRTPLVKAETSVKVEASAKVKRGGIEATRLTRRRLATALDSQIATENRVRSFHNSRRSLPTRHRPTIPSTTVKKETATIPPLPPRPPTAPVKVERQEDTEEYRAKQLEPLNGMIRIAAREDATATLRKTRQSDRSRVQPKRSCRYPGSYKC